MAQVDWYIEGAEFSNCKCDYACPCQFESRGPTTVSTVFLPRIVKLDQTKQSLLKRVYKYCFAKANQ
jgi:hypothetical protein